MLAVDHVRFLLSVMSDRARDGGDATISKEMTENEKHGTVARIKETDGANGDCGF